MSLDRIETFKEWSQRERIAAAESKVIEAAEAWRDQFSATRFKVAAAGELEAAVDALRAAREAQHGS